MGGGKCYFVGFLWGGEGGGGGLGVGREGVGLRNWGWED